MLAAHHHHHGGLPDPHDQPPIACDRDWDLVARVRTVHCAGLQKLSAPVACMAAPRLFWHAMHRLQ